MKSNPVVHFEIYVQDMVRAKAFYEAVLEAELEHLPSPVPEVDISMWMFPVDKDEVMGSYGAGGMLVQRDGFSPGGTGTLVYFGCDDCAVQVARSVKHGGSIIQKKSSTGGHGFYALALDTEGNMIGFHSTK